MKYQEKCAIHLVCTIRYVKVALKRKGWELTVDGSKVMSSVVSS